MVGDDYLCMWQAAFFQYRIDCLTINCVWLSKMVSTSQTFCLYLVFHLVVSLITSRIFSVFCIWGSNNKVPATCTCMQERVRLHRLEHTRMRMHMHKHWRGYKDWTLQGHDPTSTTIRPTLRGTGPFSSSKHKKKEFEYLYATDVCLLWIVKLIDTKTFLIALLWSLVAEDKTCGGKKE